MHRPFALFSVGHAKAMLMLLLGVLATTQAFLIPSAPFTLSSSTLAPLSSGTVLALYPVLRIGGFPAAFVVSLSSPILLCLFFPTWCMVAFQVL